jgi:hypothetical protein
MNKDDIKIGFIPNNLKISQFTFDENEEGDRYIEFECTNNGKYKFYNLSAQLSFYDEKDRFLGTESGDNLESYLNPDQSWAFSIYLAPRENTKYAKINMSAVEDRIFSLYKYEILFTGAIISSFILYKIFISA